MTPSRSASSSEAPLKAPMKAPEGGYGWVIASVAFVSNLFGAGLNASFGLYMEPLIQVRDEKVGHPDQVQVRWTT